MNKENSKKTIEEINDELEYIKWLEGCKRFAADNAELLKSLLEKGDEMKCQ